MTDVTIEQALFEGPRCIARSPGFHEDWLGHVALDGSGGSSLFAQPCGKDHVAIARTDCRRGHVLVLTRGDYAGLGGDPFALAERFPPHWDARGDLPSLSVPALMAHRTVEEVRRVLQRDNGPSLLGAAQSLLDGGRVVFVRPESDPQLLHDLWTLLPVRTRCDLWPATFAAGTIRPFHAVVVPQATGDAFADYIGEEQAAQYPEGRYELSLQVAAESGDQAALDALFHRRTQAETWRLGVMLLCFLLVVLLVMNWLHVAPAAKPDLLPAKEYAALTDSQRQRLTETLRTLAEQLGAPLPQPATAETLFDSIVEMLGPGMDGRDPGADLTAGPLPRRLRALLWKHGLPEYNNYQLNPMELVERLRQRFVP